MPVHHECMTYPGDSPGPASGLLNRAIIPGIRADTNVHSLPISATQGILPRLQAVAAGARFSKWHAPILSNSSPLPSQADLEVQAKSLARCAAIGQQADLTIGPREDSQYVLCEMRCTWCAAGGSLIKPSFPQAFFAFQSTEEIGLTTVIILARQVPVAVEGVVFISGKNFIALSYLSHPKVMFFVIEVPQRDVVADKVLANSPLSHLPHLTFSFGRGL
ncbi:aldolase [Suillus subluteus]|nr:aldolase [Suillus subluteus]